MGRAFDFSELDVLCFTEDHKQVNINSPCRMKFKCPVHWNFEATCTNFLGPQNAQPFFSASLTSFLASLHENLRISQAIPLTSPGTKPTIGAKPLAPGISSPALWDTSSLPVHMELKKDPMSPTTARHSTKKTICLWNCILTMLKFKS